MSNRFDVLERFAPLFPAPEPSFEGFLRRRDRKRRNQRMAAGIVGLLFFVAPVAFFAGRISVERTQVPAGPGPTVSPGPTVTPSPAVVGVIGLPPEGAKPSTPTHGRLVLGFLFGHSDGDPGRFSVNVYADGRMIWQRLSDPPTGLVEQRLTPEGVELLRSDVLSTGLFDRDRHLEAAHGLHFGQIDVLAGDRTVRLLWGDCCDHGTSIENKEMPTQEEATALQQLDARIEGPAAWLPASAWQDPEMTAYVASMYSVCFEGQPGNDLAYVLASLPPHADALLRAHDIRRRDYTNLVGSHVMWCSVMATDDARALARSLDQADPERYEDVFGYRTEPRAGYIGVRLADRRSSP